MTGPNLPRDALFPPHEFHPPLFGADQCGACGAPAAAAVHAFRSPLPQFDGETYDPPLDHQRLGRQLAATLAELRARRGAPRSLRELADAIGAPEASVSARLRDLRKEKFGGLDVRRRRLGAGGTWHYWLEPSEATP